MRGPAYLRTQTGPLITAVGAAYPGERAVLHGQDLHADLMGLDWMAVYAFSLTGRKPDAAQTRLMNALWVVTGYPDARIWCNRVAALAGTARSTANLAAVAANAIAEATIYGRRNEFKAISFFIKVQTLVQGGEPLEAYLKRYLAEGGRLPGYGRPLVNGDERIPPIMAAAKEVGLDQGPYVRLAFEIDRLLLKTGKPLRMNYGGLVAAFGADLGFTPAQFQQFMFPSLLAGMAPCYAEARELPEGARFPLSVDAIVYEGHDKRRWR